MNDLRVLGYAFGAAGALLVAGCLFAVVRTVDFQRHAIHASGVVVDQRITSEYQKNNDGTSGGYVRMYAPVFEFDAPTGRQRLFGHVRSSTPSYRIGQHVDVLYPQGAPAEASIDDFWENWLAVVVLAPLALAFGGIGTGFGIYFWRRRRLFRWLQRFGLRVRAACVGAELDTSISSGTKHPWRVTCEWQDPATMKLHRLQSDPVWPDPRPRIMGQTLEVLVNPADPRQYRIDVAHLM